MQREQHQKKHGGMKKASLRERKRQQSNTVEVKGRTNLLDWARNLGVLG